MSHANTSPTVDASPDAVPDVDWTLFRAALLGLTDAELREIADEEHREGFAVARQWFDRDDIGQLDDVAAFLVANTEEFPPALQIARLRGCQAGAFAAGWHLKLNPKQLLGELGGGQRLATWNMRVQSALRRIRSPLLPAIAVALLTPDVTLDDLSLMVVDDLAERDGHMMIRVGGVWLAPPEEGEMYLRSYWFWRLEGCDQPNAPLWQSSYSMYIRTKSFRPLLKRLTLLTGEPFGAFNQERRIRSWSRRGLSCTRLRT